MYVPTHPDDVAPASSNSNLVNPTYGQQAPETHEYDYVRVENDINTNNLVRQNNDSNQHNARVNKSTDQLNQQYEADTNHGAHSPQYETVYPDDSKYGMAKKNTGQLTRLETLNSIDTSGGQRSSEYVAVYPGYNTRNYDAEYGAVNFIENDLYNH